MISSTDLRLIAKLEENGRASYIDLAKMLGINPSTVAKKVRNLLDEAIIDVKAVPNPYKMGHTANALIATNVYMNRIDDVCNRLKTMFHVNMIVTTFGRFNLILAVHYQTWDSLLNFVSTELSEAGDIYEIETFFVKGIQKRYYGTFCDHFLEQNCAKIDDIDLKIIEELSNNGRYSCMYLSDKLGISLSSASKRLASLLKENVVQIRAITSPTKMGYHSNAFIFIRAEHNKIEEICDQLYPYKEVSTLMTFMNGYDIYASVLAMTPESLYDFIKKKIAALSGIISMETLIRGELVKRYYGSFHLDEENLRLMTKSNNRP
jgi:Lrp/AsnC family transcriptional regulator for asnA, asnC and gidA